MIETAITQMTWPFAVCVIGSVVAWQWGVSLIVAARRPEPPRHNHSHSWPCEPTDEQRGEAEYLAERGLVK